MRFVKLSILLIGLFITNTAAAAPDFPPLSGRVVDEVGIILPATKAAMISKLAELEQQSGIQVVVAVVSSLQDYEIRDYGYQLGRHWEIGQKDKNNGVLLLVAPNERKVSIEVGYGLEGSLTDATSHQIIQDYILPNFKNGEMSKGIRIGVDLILQAISGEITEQSLAEQTASTEPQEFIFAIIFFIVVIFLIFNSVIGFGRDSLFSSGRSSTRSSSWGGSLGGSGSSSGFTGGGGSFGGGGASGGW
ncbi:MAG: TPM domain-containing protein [Rhizobiales bacterium]|nr:TPM domain-containing protein [Hyphomicrobiales bacterium]NRB15172.1 TPM domain-containing protein [Hyphomicrobiales bacterium]